MVLCLLALEFIWLQKADVCTGLQKGLAEDMKQKEADWMTSGKYGLIQFCSKRLK